MNNTETRTVEEIGHDKEMRIGTISYTKEISPSVMDKIKQDRKKEKWCQFPFWQRVARLLSEG